MGRLTWVFRFKFSSTTVDLKPAPPNADDLCMTQRRVTAGAVVKDQFQERVDFLEEIAPIWQERMGLDHIEIEHHYLDASSALLFGSGAKHSPHTIRCGYNRGGETTFTAFVETRWNYQMADVYFMLPSIIQWEEERLRAVLVHEYAHILCAPEQYLLDVKIAEVAAEEAMTTSDLDALAGLYYERMEMATENVARAVLRAGKSVDDQISTVSRKSTLTKLPRSSEPKK